MGENVISKLSKINLSSYLSPTMQFYNFTSRLFSITYVLVSMYVIILFYVVIALYVVCCYCVVENMDLTIYILLVRTHIDYNFCLETLTMT